METYIVALALVIFVALVWWKGKSAIIGGIDGKIAQIRAEIDEAGRLREEAERLYAEKSKLAEGAADAANAIVRQAREEAERNEAGAIAAFEALTERRREQAAAKIAQAEAEAIRAVRAEATSVALAAARQVIRHELSGDRKDALLDAAISELPGRLA